MNKKNIITWLVFLLAAPATLLLGSRLPGRWYYLTATLIILELLIPFFLSFEGRRPQARELVVIAVMCALAVAARVAIPIPNFKAIYGIVMIAGIALGAESGFLVGAVSALASNFLMSQGPYTPWQMMAYGLGGMVAGFLFRKGGLPRKPLYMGIAGFACVVLLMGPLLDTCSVFFVPMHVRAQTAAAIYLAGLPVNLLQGACTFLVMFLLGKPLLEKLERLGVKYGMMGGSL